MAQKPKKPGQESPLQKTGREIDRFLEGDADTLSPETRHVPEPASRPQPADQAHPEQAAGEAPRHPPLSLTVSDDGLTAVLSAVHPGTSMADVQGHLKQHGICTGISEQGIRNALDAARKTGVPVRNIVAARGVPSEPPEPVRIQHRPPAGLDALPSLAPVRKLLDAQDRGELRRAAASTTAWAVRPGRLLAVRVGEPGKSGITVQGQPIPPPAPEEEGRHPLPQPGAGVALAPNGADYLASDYGYAGILDGTISVMPPIWIAPDAMSACFLDLPRSPESVPPRPDDLETALASAGVSVGIDDAALAALCNRLASGAAGQALLPLAAGRHPEPPTDAAVAFFFLHQPQAGAVQEDGSIDFKERGLFPSVQKDALLAECTPPIPGELGWTVRGDEIPAHPPGAAELIAGDGVRLETQDKIQRLYADTDGGVSVQTVETRTPEGPLKRYTVAVRPVLQIPGDICYETGSIDFRGNVEIRGSVARGFRAIATGDIAISGSVDAGSEVKSGGNITVRQGIVGEKTRVSGSGAVAARFVQDARIEADGDLLVGSYIHGAQVRVGGRVRVEGRGGSGGGIVGGETWAVLGIVSRNLGSERSAATCLTAGTDPDLYSQYERAAQMAAHAGTLLGNLLKGIGLPALKAQDIRRLIVRNPGRKHAILHYVQKANQLAQTQEKHRQEQQALRARIVHTAGEATVDVSGTAYARVRLRIGSEQTVLQSNLKRVRFHIDPNGETPGVFWTDLSGIPRKDQ